jgi:hypothetical protein
MTDFAELAMLRINDTAALTTRDKTASTTTAMVKPVRVHTRVGYIITRTISRPGCIIYDNEEKPEEPRRKYDV